MTAPIRNMTEYSIIMEMTKITICQQNDLDSDLLKNEFNEDYPCHIYFICRRPRVMIVPEKCYFKGELMNLTFAIQKQLKFQEYTLCGSLGEDCSDFKLVSDYPFSKFQVYKSDDLVIEAKSSLYYNMHLRAYNKDMDLEVLYIGQSYGVNGARTSPDRL